MPLSILLALGTSVIIYVLIGFVAVGLQDYSVLAGSDSPLANAARAIGNFGIVVAISLGALIAMASVLLTNLLGLSRVSFAMARNGQLPKSAAKVHPKLGTPYVSVLVMGMVTAFLTCFLDLKQTAAIASFSILSTHLVLNYSAIKLRKKMPSLETFKSPMYPLIPLLGLVSCIVLMFSLLKESWISTAVVIVASSLYYLHLSQRD